MTPRILAVRLGSLGDIVHALPAVASLRAAFPAGRLDWLVETRWREFVVRNPDVNQVVAVDTLSWRRRALAPVTWGEIRSAVRALRAAGYDLAVDFQGLFKSALLARLSGAPRRIGFERGSLKEPAAATFYTETVRPATGAHVIEMNLALARAAGAAGDDRRFSLPTSPEEEGSLEAILRRQQIRGDYFVLSPGGGWGSKRWPPERYAQLHNELARRTGWRSFLNAGPGEEELVSRIVAGCRVTRPVNSPLTLGQLIALLRRARVVVAGDTGPLHLAAALGTPVVGLYGPTDPARNGPVGPEGSGRAAVLHHAELATITYKREERPGPALLAITVEEVVRAVERVTEAAHG